MNYYNENDPKAAAWLQELINQNLIPNGHVDTRSIAEVEPSDLEGFHQCHFFAGIGGWSLALRLAGWPEDRPVWTGSCPCQPFSVAGKGRGTDDERHLWPVFRDLIGECRPPVVFGEQVASKAGREWLAGVFAEVEKLGYAAAGADLCAAGVGAPHIRQRLWWVADAGGTGREVEVFDSSSSRASSGEREADGVGSRGTPGGVADSSVGGRNEEREDRYGRCEGDRQEGRAAGSESGVNASGGLGHALDTGLEGHAGDEHHGDEPGRLDPDAARPTSETGGDSWDNAILVPCRDGKSRRIEPGIAPVAHGVPARVVRLRGYGNAIVPPLAAEFILAYSES